nr:hypothetical protein Iba_scaffold38699CG0250 [Ipomoea batatas]
MYYNFACLALTTFEIANFSPCTFYESDSTGGTEDVKALSTISFNLSFWILYVSFLTTDFAGGLPFRIRSSAVGVVVRRGGGVSGGASCTCRWRTAGSDGNEDEMTALGGVGGHRRALQRDGDGGGELGFPANRRWSSPSGDATAPSSRTAAASLSSSP